MSKRSPRLLFTQEERTAPELKKQEKLAIFFILYHHFLL